MVCFGAGIILEIVVVIQHFFIPYYIFNAFVGLGASTLLVYGALRILTHLSAWQSSYIWVLLACVSFLSFRVVDVIVTLDRHYFAQLLGVPFDLDEMMRNLLLVFSGMLVLAAVLRAMYVAHTTQELLIQRNEALDREAREHKDSELQARISQETLTVLINALPAVVFLLDRDGRIVVHNRHFAKLYGDSEMDFSGIALRDVMPASVYEEGIQHGLYTCNCTSGSRGFINRFRGRIFDVKEYPVQDEKGNVSGSAVFAQDITERLAAEESRQLLETAVTCAAESIMVTDKQGHIEYVNPAFEHTTGYGRAEVVGHTPSILRSGHHDADFYRMLWARISNGAVWRGEFLNRRKDGVLLREHVTISPITDSQGAVTHYVAVKRDITRERELERQVQQTQKIDIIGTLAGGIAHDFNNVLAIILGHSELMCGLLDADHSLRKHLEAIMRTASRSSKLTKRLLVFSRENPEESGPLQASPIIQEQINIVRAYLPSNIQIIEMIAPDTGCIYSELSEVQQVVVNLCTNANYAMQPDGGTLEIVLEAIDLDAVLLTSTGELEPGAYVRLRLQDTGCGMDEETMFHIFEPFFTTKKAGAGTGLGLSMVHGSVTRFGGGVDVHSKPGQGARFDVYWPIVARETPQQEEPVEILFGEGRCVLVVDDVEDFSVLTELNLVNHGFQVKAMSNPYEAVAYYQAHEEEIEAVITDYMMPEMNGRELALAIHDIRPNLPVVLLTGYASGITEENAHEHGFSLVLRKPVSSDLLASSLIHLIPRPRQNAAQQPTE